jgi:cold shock CspA family protein
MESIKSCKLKKWFPERGFGFIEEISKYGIRREYFVHATAIRIDSADPVVGSDVTFTPVSGPRGLAAIDVRFSPKVEITDAMISTLTMAVRQ